MDSVTLNSWQFFGVLFGGMVVASFVTLAAVWGYWRTVAAHRIAAAEYAMEQQRIGDALLATVTDGGYTGRVVSDALQPHGALTRPKGWQ